MGGMLHYQVDWRSLTGSPIDLDAHAFDAWDCHVFLGVFFCAQENGSVLGGRQGGETELMIPMYNKYCILYNLFIFRRSLYS